MPAPRTRRNEILALLALLAVSVLVFAPSLGAGFTFDDFAVVIDDPARTGIETFVLDWGARPLRDLTFRLDRALFGAEPAGYHLHSVLWHVACVLLLQRWLRRLGVAAVGAFLGALLFAVHPAHVEAVANVANRKESLCLAFSLATCLAWVRVLETRGARRALWIAASAACLYLALLAKQVAVAVPLALLAYEGVLVPRERRLLLARPRRLVLCGGALAAVVALGIAPHIDLGNLAESHTLKGWTGDLSVQAVVLTAARAFWRYVQILVLPAGLCPDHAVALSRSLAEPATALAWLALAALVGSAFGLRRNAPLAAFGLLWLLVHWLPVSNLVPSSYILAERYLYAPSVGLSLVAAWAAAALSPRLASRGLQRATVALAALALTALGTVTWRTAARWHSEETLWAWALECNPASHRAHNEIGNQRQNAGAHADAIEHYTRAVELGFLGAHYNRANSLAALGRHEEAVRDYGRALDFAPELADVHLGRGVARAALGDHARALEDFDRALGLGGDGAQLRLGRGASLLALGRHAEAEAEFSRATSLDDSLAAAHYDLGVVRLRRGALDEARASFVRAASLGLANADYALALLDGAQPSH